MEILHLLLLILIILLIGYYFILLIRQLPNRRRTRSRRMAYIKVIATLVVGLVFLGLIINGFSHLERAEKTLPKSITLKDDCFRIKSVHLIQHTIGTSDECKAQCFGKCNSYKMHLGSFDFTEINNSCNTCSCICEPLS